MNFTALLVIFQSLWVSVRKGDQVNGEDDEKPRDKRRLVTLGPYSSVG